MDGWMDKWVNECCLIGRPKFVEIIRDLMCVFLAIKKKGYMASLVF